jgi:hypothetical protein
MAVRANTLAVDPGSDGPPGDAASGSERDKRMSMRRSKQANPRIAFVVLLRVGRHAKVRSGAGHAVRLGRDISDAGADVDLRGIPARRRNCHK